MAANDVNIKINLDDYGSASTIGELKKQLKDLKSAALEAGEGSVAFDKITQKAGELNDQITRVNENIKLNTGSATENAAKGLVKVASVGVGAFQAVQGAMAVFGVESEDLQKTLVALNGAMALSQGLSALAEAPDTIRDVAASFKGLFTSVTATTVATEANAVATGEAAVAETALATTTTAAAGSMGLLSTALIATGIGAFAVLVGVLINNMTDLSGSTEDATKDTESFGKAMDKANDTAADQIVQLNKLVAVAKDESLAKKDRLKAVKELNEIAPKYLNNLTLENINTQSATESINLYTAAIIRNAKALAAQQLLVDIEKQILNAEFADKMAKAVFDMGQATKGIDQAFVDSSDAIAKNLTDIGAIPKLTEDQLKNATVQVDKFISTADRLSGEKERLLKIITDNSDDFGRVAKSAKDSGEKIINQAKIDGEDLVKLKEERELKNLKITEDSLDKEKKLYEDFYDNLKKMGEDSTKNKENESIRIRDISKSETNAAIDDTARLQEQKNEKVEKSFQIAQSFGNLAQSLNEAFTKKGDKLSEESAKKAFQRSKALSLVQTTINGAQAISSIIGQYPKFDGGIAMVAALVAAGTAIATQYAVIASQTYNPNSTGSSNSPSSNLDISGAGTQQPSTFTAPQFFGLGNGTNPNGGNQPSPLQVYVLENDITNAQQNVLGYIQTSVLNLGQPENTNGPFGPI